MNIATQPLDNSSWPAIVAILTAIPRFEASYTAWEALEDNDARTRTEFAQSVLMAVTEHGLFPGIQHESDEQIATKVFLLLLGHTINANNDRDL